MKSAKIVYLKLYNSVIRLFVRKHKEFPILNNKLDVKKNASEDITQNPFFWEQQACNFALLLSKEIKTYSGLSNTVGSKLVINLPAPHVWQRSGSHSLTAKKHGHCLVLHCALQRQPGKRFWPDGGEGQSVIVSVNEREKHERQVTQTNWVVWLKTLFLTSGFCIKLKFFYSAQREKQNSSTMVYYSWFTTKFLCWHLRKRIATCNEN